MKIYEYGDPDARIVLIWPVDGQHMEGIERAILAIKEKTSEDFRLIAVAVDNWNDELSPWKAPAVFGADDFGGGAGALLNEVLKLCEDKSRVYYIGGYSLAALFALWAAYRTDVFAGVAAASPSMWFPGFIEYMRENEIKSRRVYMSLGDKEEKVRNAVMSTVGDNIRQARELLVAQNVDCVLEWNPGNHFKDANKRTVKAFAWVLEGA